MGKTTSKFSPEIELFIERYVAELCSGTAAVFAGPGYPMAAVAELGRLARYWACPRRRSGSRHGAECTPVLVPASAMNASKPGMTLWPVLLCQVSAWQTMGRERSDDWAEGQKHVALQPVTTALQGKHNAATCRRWVAKSTRRSLNCTATWFPLWDVASLLVENETVASTTHGSASHSGHGGTGKVCWCPRKLPAALRTLLHQSSSSFLALMCD
ncbi:hypothetical protein RSP822_19995 [Ralstonia solanacearum]|nr:hypothetical protein RSP822_19995 [Ralstonia solanacearum]